MLNNLSKSLQLQKGATGFKGFISPGKIFSRCRPSPRPATGPVWPQAGAVPFWSQFPHMSGSSILHSGIVPGVLPGLARLCGIAEPQQGVHNLSLAPRGEVGGVGQAPRSSLEKLEGFQEGRQGARQLPSLTCSLCHGSHHSGPPLSMFPTSWPLPWPEELAGQA